jgi:hypothetical protein
MLLTSRSFEEYAAFFGLDADRLPDRVLDCGGGASSFVAGACARGVDAIAADPVYVHDEQSLLEAGMAGATGGANLITAHQDRFTYAWYGSAERRSTMRATAAAIFREHRHQHPERYVAASLPALPFTDQAFALALCSHLLFTWADRFDERWHLDSLVELCRVAAEVRVFPLALQGSGEPIRFLPGLRRRLHAEFGITSQITDVAYEFQIGAHHMLTLNPDGPASSVTRTSS